MLRAAFLFGLATAALMQHAADSKLIAPGMELSWLAAKNPSPIGDSQIAVLRIEPTMWELELVGLS